MPGLHGLDPLRWTLFVALGVVLVVEGDVTARVIGIVMLVLLVGPVIVYISRRFAKPAQ